MAIQSTGFSAAASPFCRPEEDPFLLLESCGKAIESILRGHAGRPLRRTWIDRPYGEEEISRLEEEVLPAIQQCLARVDEIDSALEAEAQLSYRQQVAAEAAGGKQGAGAVMAFPSFLSAELLAAHCPGYFQRHSAGRGPAAEGAGG